MVSYPTSVWDGDSVSRDSDSGNKRSPDYQDYVRMIGEVAATQTQINSNAAGIDSNTIHTVGTVATKTGLSVVEKGNGAIHKTIITLASVLSTTTVGGTPATDGAWNAEPLYTFPEGYIQILGAHLLTPIGLLIATTQSTTSWLTASDFGMGVGTVAAANSSEFGLSTTEEDIIAEITCALSSFISDAAEAGQLTTVTAFDGTAGAKELYLNIRALAETDYGTVSDSMSISGTFGIVWTMLGDD